MADRVLYAAERFPELSEGGYDLDLKGGAIRFRATGRTAPVSVLGTEGGGQWIWGHENPSFPDELVQLSLRIPEVGERYGERAFQVAGFNIPEWAPGQLLSGMSCAVIAAGLSDAPLIYMCHDAARDARLYVALLDEELLEPTPPPSVERIVLRLPKVLSLAAYPPHQGGITLVDPLLALDGYCRSLGVDGAQEGDVIRLSAQGQQAQVRITAEGISMQMG